MCRVAGPAAYHRPHASGPFLRTSSTCFMAVRSSPSQVSERSPTSRTHHASASARARDARLDERVEDLALRLAQPGHDRGGEV